MTIVFAPLSGSDNIAHANGRLRLRGVADAYEFAEGEAVAVGTLDLTGHARGAQAGAPPIIVPPSLSYGSMSIVGDALASFDQHVPAAADDLLGLAGSAFASSNLVAGSTDAFASGSVALIGYAIEEPSAYGFGFLVERSPVMGASANALIAQLAATFAINDAPRGDYMVAVAEVLQLLDSPSLLASFLRTVHSDMRLRDLAVAVFEREVLSDVQLDDDVAHAAELVAYVTSQLLLQDEAPTVLATISTVVAALALRDAVRAVLQGEVPSTLELDDLVESRLNAIIEAAAELVLADQFESSLSLFTLVESAATFSDGALANLAALVEVLAGLELGVRLRIGDELFVGYALNLRNGAVSEYDNYPFNSMAVVGGTPYGAGPDGIYRLEGDTDAGAPIAASLRTGAMVFDHLARVPYARMVFTADGQLLLRTITMDTGRRKVSTYRMAQRPLGTPVETRVEMAKGTTGTAWAFELVNEDGAYFEADVLQVWVLQLSRRYSGR